MSVVDKIQHYQRSLERCTDNGTRTLHCIEKLYRLPVTVQHLQETGVGRTVNALRKYDGSIGDAAKALVAKWKTMVVDEDTSDGDDEDEACVPDAPEGYSDHSNSPKPEKRNRDDSSRNSSKHRSTESHNKSRNRDKHESRHGTKSSSSESTKQRENETKASKETGNDRYSKNGIDKKETKNETRTEKNAKSARDAKSENSRRESSREEASNRGSLTSNKSAKIRSEDGRKSSSRVSSSSGSSNHSEMRKNQSRNPESARKRKTEGSPSSEREMSKRRKSMESLDEEENQEAEVDDKISEDDDDRPTQILSRDSDNETCKILPDTSFDSDSDSNTIKTKIKEEITDSPAFNERSGFDSRISHKSSKSKIRESAEKSTSSVSEKSRRDNEKRDSAKNEREGSSHRKSEKRKDDKARSPNRESSSRSRSQSSSSSKDHGTNKEKDKLRKSSKSKRDGKTDSANNDQKEKFKEPKDKKMKKKKMKEDDGIDCNSGASFAEALGMCQDRSTSRKKNPVSPSSPLVKTVKTEPGTSSSSMPSSSKSPVKIKTEPAANDSQALSLLAPNVKLEPLNVDLASTLPEISPNYKPLPAHYPNPLHRRQDEDKALSDVIYSRGQRTKVYSGNKSGYSSVPTLCEVCIRVLIQHMDALGFTGGIPYDILKPVLERAMPDQLFTLENYNPYLIEDTDSLWQFHCQREFREKQREEMESWRDMYMRCRDEREVKFRALTANIKESIDKSVPVRSAKLAYVDNVVKPPRNVLRNQAKYGTAKSSTSSSDLKKKLILSGNSNAATNISVPPPPMSRMKSSSSSIAKKNKAPLMAKALQLIKARYKR